MDQHAALFFQGKGQFLWSDDWEALYTNWGENQPSGVGLEEGGRFHGFDYLLNFFYTKIGIKCYNCITKVKVICRIQLNVTLHAIKGPRIFGVRIDN